MKNTLFLNDFMLFVLYWELCALWIPVFLCKMKESLLPVCDYLRKMPKFDAAHADVRFVLSFLTLTNNYFT